MKLSQITEAQKQKHERMKATDLQDPNYGNEEEAALLRR